MKHRLMLIAAVLVVGLVCAPAANAARPSTGMTAPLPIIGQTCTTSTGAVGTVSAATFTVTSFTSSAGQLLANGVATVTCLTAAGPVTQTQTLTGVPVTGTSGSCRVLDLTLGPLHLDLLGLVVDLNQVHLQITAQSGPGNLLGNLLCGVANALNGGASSNVLASLLNQILAILG